MGDGASAHGGGAHGGADRACARPSLHGLVRLVEQSADVVLLAVDGVMAWVSPSLEPTLGWRPDEWVGGRFEDYTHPEDVELARRRRRLIHGGARLQTTLRMRDRWWTYHWVHINAGPFEDAHLQRSIVASFRVVDGLRAEIETLRRRAERDENTGALRRGAALAVAASAASGAERADAALYIDCDGFKAVNDTAGHAAGDAILRLLVFSMQRAVRASDVVARLGGDEFAVLLRGVSGLAEARAIAEGLQTAWREARAVSGCGSAVTLSIGIALRVPGESAEAPVARADAAMYEAKRAGGDRCAAAAAVRAA